jgi:hypothetical protein
MTHTLKAVTIAAFLAAVLSCVAATPKTDPPKSQPLTKMEVLAVEAISRRQRDVNTDTAALMSELCGPRHIEVSVCEFAPDGTGMRVKTAEKPAAAAKK